MFDRHWNQKPSLGTKINVENPLAQGLAAFWPFNEGSGLPVENVSGRVASANKNTWASSLYGTALTGNADTYVSFKPTPQLLFDGPISFAWFGQMKSGPNNQVALYAGSSSGTTYQVEVSLSGAVQMGYQVGGITYSSNSLTQDNGYHLCTVIQTSATTGSFYYDARHINNFTPTQYPTLYNGTWYLLNNSFLTYGFYNPMTWMGVWARALTVTDMEALVTNPWQIYKPGNVAAAIPMMIEPGFSIQSPSAVYNDNASTVLTLVGFDTTWSDSTTFSASGISGVSVIGQSVTGAEAATVTVETGSVTGTATLTDGTLTAPLVVSQQSMVASPYQLPANHSGHITITLTGTGTTWSSESTTFSVSGLSGVAVASQTINSATSATVEITTGSETGACTLSDGFNTTPLSIVTATLSVSAATAAATATITLTGTNTVWSQENPSTLFSLSGVSSASLVDIAVLSNTSATAQVGASAGNGSATITDNSTTATTTITTEVLPASSWHLTGSALLQQTGGAVGLFGSKTAATLAFFFKANSNVGVNLTTGTEIIGFSTNSANGASLAAYFPSKQELALVFYGGDNGGTATETFGVTVPIQLGIGYHFLLSWGTAPKLYLNGLLYATASFSNTATFPYSGIQVGGNAGSGITLDHLIQDLCIWSGYAASQTDAYNLAFGSTTPLEIGGAGACSAWWPLGGGTVGSTPQITDQWFNDYTSKGNTLSVVAGTSVSNSVYAAEVSPQSPVQIAAQVSKCGKVAIFGATASVAVPGAGCPLGPIQAVNGTPTIYRNGTEISIGPPTWFSSTLDTPFVSYLLECGSVERIAIVNGGANYTAPTITASGGGGSGLELGTPVLQLGVTSYIVKNGGLSGTYGAPPAITITDSGGGSGATAYAIMQGASVYSVVVTDGGSNYVNPVVSFSAGTGNAPTATAVVSGGVITAINVTYQGNGYSGPPGVWVSSGTANLSGPQSSTSAHAVAVVYDSGSGSSGEIREVLPAMGGLIGCGSGYSPALVSFTGNTTEGSTSVTSVSSIAGLVVGQAIAGTGIAGGSTITAITTNPNTITLSLAATATETGTTITTGSLPTITVGMLVSTNEPARLIPVLGSGGEISAINVAYSYQGTGYPSTVAINISDPNGTGATATATMSGGGVSSVTMTAHGSGYTNPSITIAPSGSAVSITPVVSNYIAYVPVTSGGSGYTGLPTLTVSDASGTGASLRAMMSGVSAGDTMTYSAPASWIAPYSSIPFPSTVPYGGLQAVTNASMANWTGQAEGATAGFGAFALPKTLLAGGNVGEQPVSLATPQYLVKNQLHRSGGWSVNQQTTSTTVTRNTATGDLISWTYPTTTVMGNTCYSVGLGGQNYLDSMGWPNQVGQWTWQHVDPNVNTSLAMATWMGSSESYVTVTPISLSGPYMGTFTGTLTSGTATVTGITSTANLAAGVQVSGTGIPAGSTILEVNSSSEITLSANATANGSTTITMNGIQMNAKDVTFSNAKVTAIGISNTTLGSGYQGAVVIFSGGGGSNPVAAATATISDGVITGVNVLCEGNSYTSKPTVTVYGTQVVTSTNTVTAVYDFQYTNSTPPNWNISLAVYAVSPSVGGVGSWTISDLWVVAPSATTGQPTPSINQNLPFAADDSVVAALTSTSGRHPGALRFMDVNGGYGGPTNYIYTTDVQNPNIYNWTRQQGLTGNFQIGRFYNTNPANETYAWSSPKIYGPQACFINIDPTFTVAASLTSGSNQMTINAGSSLPTGALLSGTGIPGATSISSVSADGTQVTMSANATATGTEVITVAPAGDYTFTVNLALTSGSSTATVVSGGALMCGSTVSGTGIPAGTMITALTSSGTVATLNNTATESGSPQLTVTNPGYITVGPDDYGLWLVDNYGSQSYFVIELISDVPHGLTSSQYFAPINGHAVVPVNNLGNYAPNVNGYNYGYAWVTGPYTIVTTFLYGPNSAADQINPQTIDSTTEITLGAISSVTINSGGTGYTSAPTVTLTGGGGTYTSATATVNTTSGAVTAVSVVGSTGYSSAPSVSFSGGGASAAAEATANLNTAWSLTIDIPINNAGVPYEFDATMVSQLPGTSLWLNIPHMSTDDLVTDIAEKVIANIGPSNNVMLEYANEIWNGGNVAFFPLREMGTLLGYYPEGTEFLGYGTSSGATLPYLNESAGPLLASHAFDVFEAAWTAAGLSSSRIQRIFGSWYNGPTTTEQVLTTAQQFGMPVNHVCIGGYQQPNSDWPIVQAFAAAGSMVSNAAGWPVDALIDLLRFWLCYNQTNQTFWYQHSQYTQAFGQPLYPTGFTDVNATATVTLTPTSVATITVNNSGSGYTSAPTVTIAAPVSGTQATATANLSGEVISSITVNTNGSGYTTAPTVSISGGGGSGAVATANLAGTSVASVTLTNGGVGYLTDPTFTVIGSNTTQAMISVTGLSDGTVSGLTLSSQGSGYTAAPTVKVTEGAASAGGLSAGSYYAFYTFVDSMDRETTVGYSQTGPLTIGANDVPTMNMPVWPTWAASMNIYLALPGTLRGTEVFYMNIPRADYITTYQIGGPVPFNVAIPSPGTQQAPTTNAAAPNVTTYPDLVCYEAALTYYSPLGVPLYDYIWWDIFAHPAASDLIQALYLSCQIGSQVLANSGATLANYYQIYDYPSSNSMWVLAYGGAQAPGNGSWNQFATIQGGYPADAHDHNQYNTSPALQGMLDWVDATSVLPVMPTSSARRRRWFSGLGQSVMRLGRF
jgi:hypothetical protein